jgi:hypothetical protein
MKIVLMYLIGIIYVLLFVFVVTILFLKINRKEKVHPGWYYALGALILLPILGFIIINYFSISSPVEVQQLIPFE